jgi:two-component system chemotaxis response regulator CheB
VIGASAGGLQALLELVASLPSPLPAALLVVIHTRTGSESHLPEILSRESALPAAFAVDGAPIEPGHIYISPPDVHLLVSGRTMCLSRGPRENGFRPAVDPLFRTASRSFGNRVMGIILSGALDDGTYGLKVLKDGGGIAVVQSPEEATFPGMPLSAIRFVEVDHVLPVALIAPLIVEMSSEPIQGAVNMARKNEPEPQVLADERDVKDMQREFGPPSGLTCPDCGGALWEIQDGGLPRYRCHVGHQYTTDGLDAAQSDAVESALWSAVRVLEEHADLREKMARRAGAAGMDVVSGGFAESARDSQRQAHTIRELLFGRALPESNPQDHPETRSPPVTVGRTNRKGERRRKPTRRRAR